MPNVTIISEGRILELSKDAGEERDESFWVAVKLFKSQFCKQCLAPMKKISVRWQSVTSKVIAGYDIVTFKCEKCGYTHEEQHPRE